MGGLWDFLEDFFDRIRGGFRKFFDIVTAWLARRWFRKILLGIIAMIPFTVYEGIMGGTSETIMMATFVLFILGSLSVSLGSLGFVVSIIRKIYFFIKYR